MPTRNIALFILFACTVSLSTLMHAGEERLAYPCTVSSASGPIPLLWHFQAGATGLREDNRYKMYLGSDLILQNGRILPFIWRGGRYADENEDEGNVYAFDVTERVAGWDRPGPQRAELLVRVSEETHWPLFILSRVSTGGYIRVESFSVSCKEDFGL